MAASFSKAARMRVAFAAGSFVLGVAAAVAYAQPATPLSLKAMAGRELFFDKKLSASKQMSCDSCHDPANHYAPSNDRAVQLGGSKLTTPGFRAVPTLKYKEYTPAYADEGLNPDGVSANGPVGGFTWDGHANSLAEQVTLPLLSSFEMANANPAAVVEVVRQSSYAALFQAAFGANVFDDADAAFADVGQALQAFQLEDESFHPYSSKFDLFAHNKIGGDLTTAELRGYEVFQDPNKGNCGACHYSGPMVGGGEYQFTDFSFEAIGVPRNRRIPAAATRPGTRATYYDLGLCNAQNPNYPHQLPAAAGLCGMFKTPTMRNVATRRVFFHNGALRTLADVIRWYNTRDTKPELWYPTVKGVVQKFDDLPAIYRRNLDQQVPFDGLPVGGEPHMTDRDMRDLECFLETLTDSYVPGTAARPDCVE